MDAEQIKVSLTVMGQPVEMAMTVPTEPVKLRRMLPLLRNMSNGFVGVSEEQVASLGKEISCRAGCGACCRQLVPVSEAEVFDLKDLVESMPDERRAVIEARFAEGMERLRASGFFERFEIASRDTDEAYRASVREYFTYGIACPFLEDESCSIHEQRPITCREYLVTSPPERCATAEGEGIENVPQVFQLKESLVSVSRRETTEELPYVPLIAVLEWARDHQDDGPERTGREWIGALFAEMARMGERADAGKEA